MTYDLTKQTMFIDNLARNIWKKRKALRYTQEQLADRAGVTAQYIYVLENGKIKNPGVVSILSISNVLGCNIADLLEEDNAS